MGLFCHSSQIGRWAILLAVLGLLCPNPAFAGGSGSAVTTGSVVVPVATTVSCSSSSVTAAPGTQTNTLTVTCTLTGNPNNFGNNANSFIYPTVLTNNGRNLNVTPVSTVTSPDTSVINITGNYSSFNGTLKSGIGNVWKVQSSCKIQTTATTPAGLYTGTAMYNWSTL